MGLARWQVNDSSTLLLCAGIPAECDLDVVNEILTSVRGTMAMDVLVGDELLLPASDATTRPYAVAYDQRREIACLGQMSRVGLVQCVGSRQDEEGRSVSEWILTEQGRQQLSGIGKSNL